MVGMDRTEVRGSLREMWDTRPARPPDGRKLGGVAVAIARRYDIDPVIVRVAFAVTAFYGVGLLLYLIGMVVLPDGRDGTVRRAPQAGALVGLAVVAFVGFGFFVGSDGGGVLLAAVALGLLFLLHRSRGSVGPPSTPTTSTTSTPPVSLVKGGQAPPSWDPLGAAPFAWDLPDPSPAPPPPPQRRPPVTAVTIGLALLAGGATALLLLATGMLTPAGVPVLLGVVLAVLGVGMLVGSFLRAGRGLVPVAVLVGILTWGALAAPLDDLPGGGVGDIDVDPTTPAELAPTYLRTAGDIDLDLRGLDLLVPAGGIATPVRTEVVLGFGDVTITVPEDADLTLDLSADAGSVRFDEDVREGMRPQLRATRDLGVDNVAEGRPLEITVRANAGQVEVLRG